VRKLLIVVVVLAIAAVVINDGAQYYGAYSGLATSSYLMGDWASRSVSRLTQAQFADELGKQAIAQHIRVTQFSIAPGSVSIWAESDVTGTWLLGPAVALWSGAPIQKAWGSDFVIKRVTTVNYR